MDKERTAKPCTSDRTQRKYCRHYNERTGLCTNPPATHSPAWENPAATAPAAERPKQPDDS